MMFPRSFLLSIGCLCGSVVAQTPAAGPDTVTVISPEDGGTPRNAANLQRIAANRYRLVEEQIERKKSGEILGQFLVEATNTAATGQTVTLDFEGTKHAYCYYRLPSGAWRRTYIGANGTSLHLSIPPGVTRISTIPNYTYGEYLAYVDSLRDARVKTDVAFTDEGGKYKVYRLRVTNPGGVKNKMKICYGKAMHAQETAGFFMTQGIIQWLLSGDPAVNLDNIVWTFYPCPDPKAAYEHLVYSELEKEPYDSGKPGRVTYYDDIAAGHHHLIQIQHMWNNEGHNLEFESYEYWDPKSGSTDVVTYPAAEPDSKLYRDWMAFWPHWYEWGTDTYWHRNGLKWAPLGGGALMLNEIYFYGKDSGGDPVANVRRQGKEWARAVSQVYLHYQKANHYWTSSHPCGEIDLTGAVLLPRPEHTLLETLTPVSGSVEMNKNANGQAMVIFNKQYEHGLGAKAGRSVTYEVPAGANAFKAVAALDDAQAGAATAEFVVKLGDRELWRSSRLPRNTSEMAHVGLPGRGQITLSVEGAAGVLANWAGAKFTVNDPDKPDLARPTAKPPAATGSIIIDPDYPHSFRYQGGERFFPMGDTAYYLMAQPTDVIAHFIDVRRAHRFNFIRIMAITDGFWPFGGTPQQPDFDTLDERALRKLDWVFDYAGSRGMHIELLLWGYGLAGGQKMWGDSAREHAWVDLLVRRYARRSNLFFYSVTNEFERYPNGVYLYAASDVAWARDVAARIHLTDPGRPVGCHPSVWITDQGSPRPFAEYQGFTQRRPQIVWPLWDRSEVNINVTQNNEGVQTRTWGPIDTGRRGLTYHDTVWQGLAYPAKWTPTGWEFEGAGMEDCVAEDWIQGSKPIVNAEFGYQYEPGCEQDFGFLTHQVHQPEAVRKKAWKIATAGGFFAAGFGATPTARTLTKGDVENFRPAALVVLYDFFTQKTAYWTLAPHLELVAAHNSLLAKPGVEYVAYFPRGGTNTVELAAGRYWVEWLHPETGRTFAGPPVNATSGRREFAPPDQPTHDWVLHLRRVD